MCEARSARALVVLRELLDARKGAHGALVARLVAGAVHAFEAARAAGPAACFERAPVRVADDDVRVVRRAGDVDSVGLCGGVLREVEAERVVDFVVVVVVVLGGGGSRYGGWGIGAGVEGAGWWSVIGVSTGGGGGMGDVTVPL